MLADVYLSIKSYVPRPNPSPASLLDIAHYDLEVMECLYIMRVRVLHKRTWGDYKRDKGGLPIKCDEKIGVKIRCQA